MSMRKWFSILLLSFCVFSTGFAEHPKSNKLAPEVLKDIQGDPCDNLFKAACVGSDGVNKYEDFEKKIKDEQYKIIGKIQDQAVQAMGYRDTNDAIKSKLKEVGIELVENPDLEKFHEFRYGSV